MKGKDMNEIELPKSDKRYKPGKIVKDAKGKYRGHPLTVIPKTMEIINSTHHDMLKYQLNPPIVISSELADYIAPKLPTLRANTKPVERKPKKLKQEIESHE